MRKLLEYINMIYIAIFLGLCISCFFVGLPLSLGRVNIEYQSIPYAYLSVVGKSYDSSIKINNSGKIYFVDCQIGLNEFCNKFYNKNIPVYNLQLVTVNEKFSAIVQMDTNSGLKIHNSQDEIISNLISSKTIYPKFFFNCFLIFTPIIMILNFFLNYRKVRLWRK